ncbi:hypothetical protein ACW9UR_23360 [Halovulum sp. GXIMD14794]
MYVPGGEPPGGNYSRPETTEGGSEEEEFDGSAAVWIFMILFGVALLVEHFLIEGVHVLFTGGFIAAAVAIAVASAMKK